MLSAKEIRAIFDSLTQLKLDYQFGYAGSYANNCAKETSDLDIVAAGEHIMSADDYFTLYHALDSLLTIKFDIVDLTALKEDDAQMDQMLLDMGLSINECSAYKTIKNETIWMSS